ncbi:MAG: sulfotransferase [Chloroflexi bacterium]|nr:MAG: sulfotransferase [Chloroflexota bacterium]
MVRGLVKVGSGVSFIPIILIGAARSGTKLLRDTIALHSQIEKVPYDINYIWRLGNEAIPHDELPPDNATPEVIRKIHKGILHYRKTQAPLLIEKTVSNSLRPTFTNRVFPNAYYIHLIRDGRDVVESSLRQWLAPPNWHYIMKKASSYPINQAFGYALNYSITTIYKMLGFHDIKTSTWGPRYKGIDVDVKENDLVTVCSLQWRYSIEKSLHGLKKIGDDRVYTLRYEDFVVDPYGYLSQIASFIGVNQDDYLGADLSHISRENVGKGCSAVTSEQLNIMMSIITEPLQQLGYI